ncbi:MAG: hypothetical protein PGN37_26655 [Mycobacterium kyogaense]|uniref:hypothetical protein n=1 Tax=Mycobacterium kyogaense TaxID=2212479 RepID=UPI002FFC5BA1
MDSNNTVWIVVAAVAAIIVIALIVFLARQSRNKRRAAEADRIREEVHHDSQRVQRQATLVEETEAKARAAQAEADAKAAEAARLAETAAGRRDALTSSQQNLDERREHADKLDPRTRRSDTDVTAEDNGVVTGGRHSSHDGQRDGYHDGVARDTGRDTHRVSPDVTRN